MTLERWYLFPPLSERVEAVILSAAGAKDLLSATTSRMAVPRDDITPVALCGTAGPSDDTSGALGKYEMKKPTRLTAARPPRP